MDLPSIGYSLSSENKSINIPCLAFADDLIPIAKSANELQTILNVINEFLSKNLMKLRPSKCFITSNEPKFLEKNYNFTIKNEKINDLRDKNTISRFLGVFWTLGIQNKAVQHEILSDLNRNLYFLNSHYCPGKQTIHLINTVVIPKLVYRLQFLPYNKSFLEKIMMRLRKCVRKNYNINNKITNKLLQAKDLDFGLFELENELEKRLFSDVLCFIQSNEIENQIFQIINENYTLKEKLPLDLLTRPNPLKKQAKSWFAFLINKMYLKGISFENKNNKDPQFYNFYKKLTNEEYQKQARFLYKYKLHDVSNLVRQSNSQKTLSFSEFWSINSKASKKSFDEVPEWFQLALNFHCNISNNIELNQAFDLQFDRKITDATQIIEQNDEADVLKAAIKKHSKLVVWTDGSLKEGIMSAATIFCDDTDNLIGQISNRVPPGNESSTKAELWAILTALENVKENCCIEVKTDSQASIDGINGFLNQRKRRKKLKYNNYAILFDIQFLVESKSITLKLEKVKAHSGILRNEQADKLAKEASENSQVPFDTVKNHSQQTYLYKNNALKDEYPGHLLKKEHTENVQNYVENRVTTLWQSELLNQNLEHKKTVDLAKYGMNISNVLDVSCRNEQIFRVNIINKSLPVLSQVKDFTFKNNQKLANATCLQCNTRNETFYHVWSCLKTRTKHYELYKKTLYLLDKRKNENSFYKELQSCKDPPTSKQLVCILTDFKPVKTFLSSINAKGIVTNSLWHRFRNSKKLKNNHALWLHYTMDCWLSAFHELVWKPRCLQVADKSQLAPIKHPIRLKLVFKPPAIFLKLKRPILARETIVSSPVKRIKLVVTQDKLAAPSVQEESEGSSLAGSSPDLGTSSSPRKRVVEWTQEINGKFKKIRLFSSHLNNFGRLGDN
jgi:ribonuclease HI